MDEPFSVKLSTRALASSIWWRVMDYKNGVPGSRVIPAFVAELYWGRQFKITPEQAETFIDMASVMYDLGSTVDTMAAFIEKELSDA